jgi:hypothetical protein
MNAPGVTTGPWEWLPDMDLNHDKQIQSLLCYRYTIGQTGFVKIESRLRESSRRLMGVARLSPVAQVSNLLYRRLPAGRRRSREPHPPKTSRRF